MKLSDPSQDADKLDVLRNGIIDLIEKHDIEMCHMVAAFLQILTACITRHHYSDKTQQLLRAKEINDMLFDEVAKADNKSSLWTPH